MPKTKTWDFTKDLGKVSKISALIEDKISKLDSSDQKKIDSLTFEQLQDFQKLISIANFILTKYEHNKEVYSLFKDFVDMIDNSTNSMDMLNDKIIEMMLSAENAISRIKNLQGDVSENYSLISKNKEKAENEQKIVPKTSTINLTKSTTPVYT